jgi:hypothetical protein
MSLRAYPSETILIKDFGIVKGANHSELLSQCNRLNSEYLATQQLSEWPASPSGERAAVNLAENIDVDQTDSVGTVIQWKEKSNCEAD